MRDCVLKSILIFINSKVRIKPAYWFILYEQFWLTFFKCKTVLWLDLGLKVSLNENDGTHLIVLNPCRAMYVNSRQMLKYIKGYKLFYKTSFWLNLWSPSIWWRQIILYYNFRFNLMLHKVQNLQRFFINLKND